ncbi:MAG: TVP38/TMEM64 family protein [Phycisphaerales bacterium]
MSDPTPGNPTPENRPDRAGDQTDNPGAAFDPLAGLGSTAKELGPGVTVPALVAALLPALGGFGFIALATTLKPWVASHGTMGMWAFAGFFAVATGFALMPTYALSFGAGVFFGWQMGGPLAVVGAGFGSLIGYALWGVIARRRVLEVIERKPKARIVRDALVSRSGPRTLFLVTLLRVPPNSPFALMNMLMSSVKVPLLSYLVGTVVGMAPRTMLAAFVGATVGSLDQVGSAGGHWRIIGPIVGVGVFLVVVMLCSRWAKKALAQELGPRTPS